MPLYIDKLTGQEYLFTSLGGGATGATPTILTATATLAFAQTNGQASRDLTIALTGAALGDVVILGVPNASVQTNSCFTAWVSASNTVTVRFNNYDVGPKTPASAVYRVTIVK